MNDINSPETILLLVVGTAITIVLIRSRIGGGIISAWSATAMALKALLFVPWGMLLLAIGAGIIWLWGGLLGWLIGGWLIYTGGNCLVGSLTGFATKHSDRDSRNGTTTAPHPELQRPERFRR
jgi:hypothetical protein